MVSNIIFQRGGSNSQRVIPGGDLKIRGISKREGNGRSGNEGSGFDVALNRKISFDISKSANFQFETR